MSNFYNPDWATADRRHDMNHFMARLIFCFFAEDSDIFRGDNLLTTTIEQMSARDSSNTHSHGRAVSRHGHEICRSASRQPAPLSQRFPHVNSTLFSAATAVPRCSKIACSYLIHIGNLDWQQINPDIFGSMIQAVADEEERGLRLALHLCPQHPKVLNPLFLDGLRSRLESAGNNARKLLNLRNRMANIRIFDPACGSGNFLVIA